MTDWPHSPVHRTLFPGTYMVTGATYNKVQYFKTADRLQFLQNSLLQLATEYQWQLLAWSVLSNHYHFIANSPENVKNLTAFISQLHVMTAKHVNAQDDTPKRHVWYQYWDTHITFPYSYFARLNYVNQNPVKHGLVQIATDYPWCSASWFEKTVPTSFYKTISTFKTDKLNISDDY